jgi:transcriptional/translational regulatory protein YebC/TACO1
LIVTVDKNNFTSVRDMLKEKNYHVIDWALRFLPENTISITWEDEKALESLMEALDEDEDVDSVYANNA